MRSHPLSTHTCQIYQIKFCHRLSDTQNHPKGRMQINIQTKAKVMKSAGVSGHEPSKGDGKSRKKPTKPQSNIPANGTIPHHPLAPIRLLFQLVFRHICFPKTGSSMTGWSKQLFPSSDLFCFHELCARLPLQHTK